MSIAASNGQTYRRDIDGLRALAVLPVVLYHAGIELFSGGYVGVDVFFVISGFLITSIIVREIGADTFRIRDFYARRIRRLFPALFAVLGCTTIGAYFVLMPIELEDYGQSLATTAVFVSNFLFFTEAGYFAGPAELKPLLHTWSLAIEEQYYLLFPAFLLLVHRRLSSRFIVWVSVLFVLSLVISIWSVNNARDAAFYLLPSRTWELMLGSLLALVGHIALPPLLRELGGLLGIVLILVAVFGYSGLTPFPGAAALLPCFGAAFIIASGLAGPPTLAMRLLSWRPIVFIGLISYSLYLWHWPILALAKHYLVRPLTVQEGLVLVAMSALVATLSWRFVERPFRKPDGVVKNDKLFPVSLVAMLGVIGIGLVLDESGGLPGRLPTEVAEIVAVAEDKPERRRRCEGIDPQELSYQRACRLNELDVAPTLAIWGDSHAMTLMPIAGEVAHMNGRNGLDFSSNGCPPLLGVTRPARDQAGECYAFTEKVLSIIADHPEIDTVVLVARWARHAEGTAFGEESHGDLYLGTPEFTAKNSEQSRALFSAAFARTVEALTQLQRRVIVLGSIPEVGRDVPIELAKARWRNRDVDLRTNIAVYAERQQHVIATLANAQVDTYLDPSVWFCSNSKCDVVDEAGMPLYFDHNHVSSIGAQRLRPFFEQVLVGDQQN